MIRVSDNIKFLRKQLGQTQEQFAQTIGIKRSLLGAYEEGRADPRLNNLIKMSDVFGVSLDALISEDVSKNDFDQNYSVKDKLRILAITVDKNEKENIEFVPLKASAGYLNGYSDAEYIEELPKFNLPNLPKNATYRAFEISGDSMLPLQSGSVVIGQYVEQPEDIKNGSTYVLITRREGVVYKRVFNYISDRGVLYLVSDNRSYSAYEVVPDDVLEIWEAKAYVSLQFPNPSEDDTQMTFERLTNIVLNLQNDVLKIRDRLDH